MTGRTEVRGAQAVRSDGEDGYIVEDTQGGWHVTRYEVVDGALLITELGVRAAGRKVPSGGITSTVLRLKMSRLHEAVQKVSQVPPRGGQRPGRW